MVISFVPFLFLRLRDHPVFPNPSSSSSSFVTNTNMKKKSAWKIRRGGRCWSLKASLVLSYNILSKPKQPSAHRLQPQLAEDLVGHALELPSVASHALELNAVQGNDWDLDNEDLKLQDHAAAQVALNMRSSLSRDL